MKQEIVVVDGVEFSLFYCDLCEEEANKNKLVLKTKPEKSQVFYTVNELAEHQVNNHCYIKPTFTVNGKSSTSG